MSSGRDNSTNMGGDDFQIGSKMIPLVYIDFDEDDPDQGKRLQTDAEDWQQRMDMIE